MLSIGLVKSPQDAVRYYEKDDYYINSEAGPDAQGQWQGKTARALGLNGPVEREAFQSLLDGTLPNGERLGRNPNGERQHTPGWDLTFSAPKSVSILVEAGLDERLLDAHHAAVRDALKWAEENVIGTRVRTPTGTVFVRTGNLAAAVFTHHTSRAQEPNLHSHAVINNVTQRGDGTYGSVHSQELFKNKMAIGQVYRSSLARRALDLGYESKKTHSDGRFELAGVPEDLVRSMSSRRTAIENKLEQWGTTDPEAAARAAIITRQRKQDVEHSTLVNLWRTFTNANGFDVDAMVNRARENGPRAPEATVNLETALKDAIDRLSEPEAVFQHGQLIRWTLAATLGTATVQQAEAAVRQASRDQKLHRVDEGGRRLWTTPRSRMQERFAIESMLQGQSRFAPITTLDAIAARLDARNLNEGQRAAVEMILTSPDQFNGIVGRPGVGKTTAILLTAKEIARDSNIQMIGMAQNALAAKNMGLEAQIPSSTIDKHLNRLGRDLATYQRSNALRQSLIRFKYRNQLWVIDESTQLSNGLARRAIYAAIKLNVRVLFMGDPKQQGALEQGIPFELLLKNGMRHVEVSEIVRQRNSIHKEAIHHAQAGRIAQALDIHAENTSAVEDRDERLKAILEHYRGLGQGRDSTLLLTARNADKQALNSGVRDILTEENKISGGLRRDQLIRVFSRRADRRDASFYKADWIIRFNRDVDSLDIKNGEYLTVRDIDAKRNEVRLERQKEGDAETIVWKPRDVAAAGKRSIEIFQPGSTALAVGEIVRWGRNSAGVARMADGTEVDLTNGEILRVIELRGNVTVFVTETGVRVAVDHTEFSGRHWEHAYATTVYGSQGKTTTTALVNADSTERNLFSQRSFAVAISRHREDLHLFVDSTEKLQASLEKYPGDKTSAIEAQQRHDATRDAQLAQRLEEEWRLSGATAPPARPANDRERS